MKFKVLFIVLISLVFHNRSDAAPSLPPPPNLPQKEIGVRLIHALMRGDSAAVVPYFEDSVAPNLTRKTLENIQGQINWLAKFLGDSLEQFMTGTQAIDSLGKEIVFYREYRLAAETNRRAPLIVIHVWFKDSLANKAAGAFVKGFLDNAEKRVAGEQSWDIDGKHVDVNSVVLVTFDKGAMMAVEVFDDDTTSMDTTLARKKGVPIVRRALAEGLLEQAKQQLEGRTMLDDIGVAFIRKDPHFGYSKFKYGIKPRDYKTAEELKLEAKTKPKSNAKPGKSKPGSKK